MKVTEGLDNVFLDHNDVQLALAAWVKAKTGRNVAKDVVLTVLVQASGTVQRVHGTVDLTPPGTRAQPVVGSDTLFVKEAP